VEVSSQFHAPSALPPEKEPPYLLDNRLRGRPLSLFECCEEESIISLISHRTRFIGRSVRSITTAVNELSWLPLSSKCRRIPVEKRCDS
jgi:hypothetical protein